MKILKSRYSIKNINEKNYDTFKLTEENKVNNEKLIWMPYIMVDKSETEEKTESDIEYDNFMEEYDNKHKLCPNCKSEKYSTTLIGYILDMNKKEDYKDLNNCVCVDCNNSHSVHDRIEK